MTKHVGFTGTQRGTTPWQRTKLAELLRELGATDFHHGDCVGADAEAHAIAVGLGCRIHLHPPTDPSKRAFCVMRPNVDVTHRSRAYPDRNQDIVDETVILIATPGESKEKLRSGTWSTVRKARRRRRPITIILPNGGVAS